MNKVTYLSWIILFFSVLNLCHINPVRSASPDLYEMDSIKKNVTSLTYQDPDSAFFWTEKGLKLALEKKDSASIAFFYMEKGILLQEMDPDLAIKYYFRAKEIYLVLKDSLGLSVVYRKLAYITHFNHEQRLNLCRKAILISQKINDSLNLSNGYLYMGIAYKRHNMKDSALFYLQKGMEIARQIGYKDGLATGYSSLGTMEYSEKNYHKALEYTRKGIRISSQKNIGPLFNLMAIHLRLYQSDSALYYYDQIKSDFHMRPRVELWCYFVLSEFYEKNQQLDKALYYYKKGDSVEQVVADTKDANTLSLLELEYKSKVDEKKIALLNAEVKQAAYIRYSLVIIFLIVLISGGIIFYQNKLKNHRTRESILQKKRRAEAMQKYTARELKHAELKNKYLNDKLKYANNELIHMATGSVQNRELIIDLKEHIEKTFKKDSLRDVRSILRELHIRLLQLLNKDSDYRKKVVDKAENINTSFIFGVKSKFPELSDKDLNLLILLLLKFNSKDIAAMHNIEERSAIMRRYRLRLKLNMKKYESFDDFFERIVPEIELFDSKVNESV